MSFCFFTELNFVWFSMHVLAGAGLVWVLFCSSFSNISVILDTELNFLFSPLVGLVMLDLVFGEDNGDKGKDPCSLSASLMLKSR